MQYSKLMLADLYRKMVTIRMAEESLVEPISNGDVKCPCHLYTGEEAVAVGLGAVLTTDDYILGNHRSHGHYLAKGGSLNEMIAEIYGKDSGCSRGRGGSMHVIDVENGMLGAAPIVGGTISLALGAALASKIRKDNRVTVSFFGDGSTGEGVLYEAMNFAALKRLPLIFVCENNLYSTHMSIRECRAKDSVYDIAKPFGIQGFRVNGNDVLKIYEIATEVVMACRGDEGPAFIECLTYRMRGHVGPDDNIQGTHTDIRSKYEIEKWKKRDPIKRFEKYLIKNNYFTKEELASVKESISAEISMAHTIAKEGKNPKIGDLTKYVFKQ